MLLCLNCGSRGFLRGFAEIAFGAVAIAVFQAGQVATVTAAAGAFALGLYAIRVLESPDWHPALTRAEDRTDWTLPPTAILRGVETTAMSALPGPLINGVPGFTGIQERAGIE